jgi:hypothetical protein
VPISEDKLQQLRAIGSRSRRPEFKTDYHRLAMEFHYCYRLTTLLDIDDLRNFFGFEIISEEDDGFVIVASEDKTLGFFQEKLRDFVESIDGSAGIAKIHELSQDLTQEERLKRILSDRLFLELPQLDTDTEYIVDVSFSCQGKLGFAQVAKAWTSH